MQSIYEKLSCIQNELNAPKNQYNSFGKYNYRNCEDILEAVKPLCKKYNTTLILSDDIVLIGDRFYVKAYASLFDENDHIEVTAFAREEAEKKGMDGSQITGASSSYARKYALGGLFNIDDNKDSDATNTGDSKPQQKAEETKTESKPKQEQSNANVDLTLDQAKKLFFKNGKNANIPFSELPDDTLNWIVNNMQGLFREGAKLVMEDREKAKDDIPAFLKEDKEQPEGLPF